MKNGNSAPPTIALLRNTQLFSELVARVVYRTVAAACEAPVKESAAADYIKHLARAGYLACVRQADKRGGRYRLVNYTGPRPPMVQRLKVVFDPNLGRVAWHEPPREDAP